MTKENQHALSLFEALKRSGQTMTTVESCTGGMIASAITDIAGSSAVFECAFVTYSNEAKTRLVGVPAVLIVEHGAVSQPVAVAMAEGALLNSTADLAIAVTGIAGPGGGSAKKPVGLVHFAVGLRGKQPQHDRQIFDDNGRAFVRQAARDHALDMALNLLN